MRISDWSSDVCSSDLISVLADIDLRAGSQPRPVAQWLRQDDPTNLVNRGFNWENATSEIPVTTAGAVSRCQTFDALSRRGGRRTWRRPTEIERTQWRERVRKEVEK